MKKKQKVIRWICVALFACMVIGALSDGAFFSAFLFLLGGVLIAPIDAIALFRKKFNLNKAITILLVVALFFVGGLALPKTEEAERVDSNVETSEDNITGSSEETSAAEEVPLTSETSSEEEIVTAAPTTTTTAPTTTTKAPTTTTKTPTTTTKAPTTTTTAPTTTTTAPTTTTAAPVIPNADIVYIAPQNGTKYHCRSNCRGLNNANEIREVTVEEAISLGKSSPCGICY